MKFLKFGCISAAAFLLLNCSDSEVDPPIDQPIEQISDAQLMEQVQKDVTKYFWNFAESNSALARERYHEDNPGLDANIITTGGSGFGFLTILVAVKNGYVPREEAVTKFSKSLNFLKSADRFHGAWSHWINGNDGHVVPFSALDNGGDIVETAFLAQGLTVVREYFKNSNLTSEKNLSLLADELLDGIDWNWYRNGQNSLTWHWSPTNGFQINQKIQGYDETMITYIMAAASETHSIPPSIFKEAWERNGQIASAASVNGVPVTVNHNGANGSVGPMFFSHYSFLALDPRGLTDQFVNYEYATANHARIMYNYCVQNPKSWNGYSSKNWGLTASYSRNLDGTTGYAAHQPNNDKGVISPTAALSSFPYTPSESMAYLRFLYTENNKKFVGSAGPYDAYSIHYNWFTPRYLAIDQGTISPMIENAKTKFFWNLFMNAPDIRAALINLGFHSSTYGF